MKSRIIFANIILGIVLGPVWVSAEEAVWHQWRGPQRDGSIEARPWPETFGKLTKQWSAVLGEGYPGPIVTSNRVFTVETKNGKSEVVRAFDRTSGKPVWEKQWEGSMKVPFFAKSNGSWVRSTPAFDSGSLYVGGMRDLLVALNASTGEVRWRRDFPATEKTPLPGFGFVCSPLIRGDYLYVQAGAALTKLEKKSGKKVWSTLQDKRAMYGSAFSSPVFATIHGKPQLVVQTRSQLAGVDPKNGAVLWSYDVKAFRNMNILTPTVIGNRVFTSSYGGGCFMFAIDKEGSKFHARKEWVHKFEGYMSSPIVIDGFIYLHGRNQRVICLDVATGKFRWESDKKFGKYWSMVANKDRILALDEKGELILMKANPEKMEIMDRKKVSERDTYAHVAVCGDQVFVRDLKGLTVFRWGR